VISHVCSLYKSLNVARGDIKSVDVEMLRTRQHSLVLRSCLTPCCRIQEGARPGLCNMQPSRIISEKLFLDFRFQLCWPCDLSTQICFPQLLVSRAMSPPNINFLYNFTMSSVSQAWDRQTDGQNATLCRLDTSVLDTHRAVRLTARRRSNNDANAAARRTRWNS